MFMSYTLIITEKPNAADRIAGALETFDHVMVSHGEDIREAADTIAQAIDQATGLDYRDCFRECSINIARAIYDLASAIREAGKS